MNRRPSATNPVVICYVTLLARRMMTPQIVTVNAYCYCNSFLEISDLCHNSMQHIIHVFYRQM